MTLENDSEKRLQVSVSTAIYIAEHPYLSVWKRRILLLQEDRDGKLLWGPPGGGIKPHEDVFKVIKREVKEEIGREVVITSLVGIYTADKGNFSTGLGFVFQGILPGNGPIVLNESEGIRDYRYFSFEEIKELLTKELIYKPDVYNRKALNDYFSCSPSGYSHAVISPLENNKNYWF
jgi:8-oxo-dGTP pyrophosphatase MutT (NUDIX family)